MNNVSIIIANYNNARYLPECFDSILNQTYKDIEIVVVDDCSTDGSRDIIQSYAGKHPGAFAPAFLGKNIGVARARHQGIIRSKGFYITTLDADDYYADKQKLEKEKELLDKYKSENNEDIIAYSNIIIEDACGRRFNVGSTSRIAQGNILDDIMARSCMIPRDFLIRKKMYFDVGGYDYRLPIYEDWDLKIRLANKYRFFYSGIDGIVYRRLGTGLSNSSEKLHLKMIKRIFNKNKALLSPDVQQSTYFQLEKFINRIKNRFLKKQINILSSSFHKHHIISFFEAWINLARIDSSFSNPGKIYNLVKSPNHD